MAGREARSGDAEVVAMGSSHRPFVGLCFLLIVSAYAFLEGSVMAIALPNVVRDLKISPDTGDLAMTLMIATSAAVLVAVGRLADLIGRRRVILMGVVLAAFSTVLIAVAWDAASLLIARAVQGIATAMILTSVALLNGMFTEAQRPRAFALFGASMGAGLALAPLVGSAALEWGSWRLAFWVNMPVLAIAYVGIRRYVPESRAQTEAISIDVIGTVLLGLGLLLALVGISEGSSAGWWSPRGDGALSFSGQPVSPIPFVLLMATVLLVGFIVWERASLAKGRAVVMDPALFKVRSFRMGCGVSFLFVLGGYSLQYLIPLCGIYLLHLGAADTGLLTATIGLGIVVGGYISAPMGGSLSPRNTVVVGIALMMMGVVGFVVALGSPGSLMLSWSLLLIIGLGYGLTYARITQITLVDVPSDSVGLASGMLVAARTTAMAFGAAAVTAVVIADSGTGGVPLPHVHDVHLALALCFAALAGAFVFALRLGERTVFLTERGAAKGSSVA
ncbi:MAG: MFS transporter [Pseudomonadota bacterium]